MSIHLNLSLPSPSPPSTSTHSHPFVLLSFHVHLPRSTAIFPFSRHLCPSPSPSVHLHPCPSTPIGFLLSLRKSLGTKTLVLSFRGDGLQCPLYHCSVLFSHQVKCGIRLLHAANSGTPSHRCGVCALIILGMFLTRRI